MTKDTPPKDTLRTPASKKIGVREIAKRVGVSPITVSRALSKPSMVSEQTREKVFNTIDQIGFVPNKIASSMRGNGRMIGTVVPPLINSGIAEQVQGMSDECHAGGYTMLLVQGEFTQAAEERAIRTLIGWRPAGFVLQSFVQSKTARTLLRNSAAPVVEISEIKGAAKGYKKIGFVSTPIHGNDRLQQRKIGYRTALKDLGLKDDLGLEVEVPLTAQGGANALIQLTERHKDIGAIFFSSDTLAVGAIQECYRRQWKVPQRIGIAGYGDMDIAAQLYPSLTTVRVNRYEMGRRAVRVLLEKLGGNQKIPVVTSLGFEIVDRESA